MLHNKHYQILKQFLGNYKGEIFGRQLVGKVKISQKGIALALEELEKQHILRYRMQGNLKLYSLNTDVAKARDSIKIAELMRKIEFLSGHMKINYLFKDDERVVGIFGSYAAGTQKESSDLDVFIIGEKKKKDYDKEGPIIDLEVSIKYFSKEEWQELLREKNELAAEIISNHVLIFGVEEFIRMSWSNYYGLN